MGGYHLNVLREDLLLGRNTFMVYHIGSQQNNIISIYIVIECSIFRDGSHI